MDSATQRQGAEAARAPARRKGRGGRALALAPSVLLEQPDAQAESAEPVRAPVWLTQAKAAEVLGISASSLMRLRERGEGPSYYTLPSLGKKQSSVRYDLADVLAYIQKRRVSTT